MKKAISFIISIFLLFGYFTFTAKADTVNNVFADVEWGSWYEGSAVYCYEHGYVKGTANGIFSPNLNLTRAMAVQIIYSMSCDEGEYEKNLRFSDVTEEKWFYSVVEWAADNGIVRGVGGDMFCPDADVTRQDFAVIMYNYAGLFADGDGTGSDGTQLLFDDTNSISDYAVEAVKWAVENNLVSGYPDNTLRPEANITRAEAAKIMSSFDAALGHSWILHEAMPRTCERYGYSVFGCSNCEAIKEVQYPEGHIRRLSESVSPDCENDGYLVYICIACGDTVKETLSAKGHVWSVSFVVEPTYTKGGYTQYTCISCSAVKNDDYTDKLERTEGWDSNYDGRLTIDEFLGGYGYADFLTEHKDDYLGTPYESVRYNFDEPWNLIHNIGQFPDDPRMNCTGFVASVVYRCGGNLDRISSAHSGWYANGYNWKRTIDNNGIFHYTFYSIADALNSGKLKKGDIIFFMPSSDSGDCHLGFFWGEKSYEDLFWHSAPCNRYNMNYGVTSDSNQISEIISVSPYEYLYVLPMQGE